jgi:hypothetical protein
MKKVLLAVAAVGSLSIGTAQVLWSDPVNGNAYTPAIGTPCEPCGATCNCQINPPIIIHG